MKTVHFFAFYPHNLLKITDFSPWSSMNLKNTKSLHFDGKGWGMFCPTSSFQMFSQSSSDAQSVLFRFPLPHLWVFTPAFMMIYSCFCDEAVEYRLNLHEYSFDFVSDVDWSTSLPRIQNFQARKILVSNRENFTFLTRINNIPAENQVHSGKEWSSFS